MSEVAQVIPVREGVELVQSLPSLFVVVTLVVVRERGEEERATKDRVRRSSRSSSLSLPSSQSGERVSCFPVKSD